MVSLLGMDSTKLRQIGLVALGLLVFVDIQWVNGMFESQILNNARNDARKKVINNLKNSGVKNVKRVSLGELKQKNLLKNKENISTVINEVVDKVGDKVQNRKSQQTNERINDVVDNVVNKVQNNNSQKTKERGRSPFITVGPVHPLVQNKPTSTLDVTDKTDTDIIDIVNGDLFDPGTLTQPRDLRGIKKENLDPLGLRGPNGEKVPLTFDRILNAMDLSDENKKAVLYHEATYPKGRYQVPGFIKDKKGELWVVRPKKRDRHVKRIKADDRTTCYECNGKSDQSTTWKFSPIAEEFDYLKKVDFSTGEQQKTIDNINKQFVIFNPVTKELVNRLIPNTDAMKIFDVKGRNKGNLRQFDITNPRIDLGGVIDGIDNSGMLTPFMDIASGNIYRMEPGSMIQYDKDLIQSDGSELRAEEKTYDGAEKLIIPTHKNCMAGQSRTGVETFDNKDYLTYLCPMPVPGKPGVTEDAPVRVRYETDKAGNALLPKEVTPIELKADEAHMKDFKHIMEAAFSDNLNGMDMEVIPLVPRADNKRFDKEEVMQLIKEGFPVILRPPGNYLDGYRTYKRVMISDLYSKDYVTKKLNDDGTIEDVIERYGSLASLLYGKDVENSKRVRFREPIGEAVDEVEGKLNADVFKNLMNNVRTNKEESEIEEYFKDAAAAKDGFLIYDPKKLKYSGEDDEFIENMRSLYLSSGIKANKNTGKRDLADGKRTEKSGYEMYLDAVDEYTDGNQYEQLKQLKRISEFEIYVADGVTSLREAFAENEKLREWFGDKLGDISDRWDDYYLITEPGVKEEELKSLLKDLDELDEELSVKAIEEYQKSIINSYNSDPSNTMIEWDTWLSDILNEMESRRVELMTARRRAAAAKRSDSAPMTLEELKKTNEQLYNWFKDPNNGQKEIYDKWVDIFTPKPTTKSTTKTKNLKNMRKFGNVVAKLNFEMQNMLYRQYLQKQEYLRKIDDLTRKVAASSTKLDKILAEDQNYLDKFIKADGDRNANYERIQASLTDYDAATSLADKVAILEEVDEILQAFTTNLYDEYLEVKQQEIEDQQRQALEAAIKAEDEQRQQMGLEPRKLIDETDNEFDSDSDDDESDSDDDDFFGLNSSKPNSNNSSNTRNNSSNNDPNNNESNNQWSTSIETVVGSNPNSNQNTQVIDVRGIDGRRKQVVLGSSLNIEPSRKERSLGVYDRNGQYTPPENNSPPGSPNAYPRQSGFATSWDNESVVDTSGLNSYQYNQRLIDLTSDNGSDVDNSEINSNRIYTEDELNIASTSAFSTIEKLRDEADQIISRRALSADSLDYLFSNIGSMLQNFGVAPQSDKMKLIEKMFHEINSIRESLSELNENDMIYDSAPEYNQNNSNSASNLSNPTANWINLNNQRLAPVTPRSTTPTPPSLTTQRTSNELFSNSQQNQSNISSRFDTSNLIRTSSPRSPNIASEQNLVPQVPRSSVPVSLVPRVSSRNEAVGRSNVWNGQLGSQWINTKNVNDPTRNNNSPSVDSSVTPTRNSAFNNGQSINFLNQLNSQGSPRVQSQQLFSSRNSSGTTIQETDNQSWGSRLLPTRSVVEQSNKNRPISNMIPSQNVLNATNGNNSNRRNG